MRVDHDAHQERTAALSRCAGRAFVGEQRPLLRPTAQAVDRPRWACLAAPRWLMAACEGLLLAAVVGLLNPTSIFKGPTPGLWGRS